MSALSLKPPFDEGTVAFLALCAVAVGFWWIYPPLGLIVPGSVILGLCVWGHLRGR